MKPALLTVEPLAISTRHVVELRDVVMRFGDKQVLDHVSLAVAPQERLVIIGQSGAGKTTILRLILGILKPNAGSIFFRQHEVSLLNDHQLEPVLMRIGMVYQDAALLSSLTVRENLALPLQELTDKTQGEVDRILFRLARVQLISTSVTKNENGQSHQFYLPMSVNRQL